MMTIEIVWKAADLWYAEVAIAQALAVAAALLALLVLGTTLMHMSEGRQEGKISRAAVPGPVVPGAKRPTSPRR